MNKIDKAVLGRFRVGSTDSRPVQCRFTVTVAVFTIRKTPQGKVESESETDERLARGAKPKERK
jgi:hypothetical protein